MYAKSQLAARAYEVIGSSILLAAKTNRSERYFKADDGTTRPVVPVQPQGPVVPVQPQGKIAHQ